MIFDLVVLASEAFEIELYQFNTFGLQVFPFEVRKVSRPQDGADAVSARLEEEGRGAGRGAGRTPASGCVAANRPER
ncbi:hypothetical protein [Microlunatus flavus]|uniref:hypothetical protein n=1 Tax=Microlunatus flavus TaxID=1036181 RepID=UPI001113B750|nr:hypothetical protein [Microlunatus flavus]